MTDEALRADRAPGQRRRAGRAQHPRAGRARWPPAARAGARVTERAILEAAQRKTLLYDKAGEEHYNLISALHKSLRDSDPDAALYWMTRMLEAGEDPLYVARRLVRFASEDVGNADPAALGADARRQGRLRFSRLAGGRAGARPGHALPGAGARSPTPSTWRTTRPRRTCASGPPSPCRCTCATRPRRLMRDLGYGAGYQYAHDAPDARGRTRSTCRTRSAAGSTTARPTAGSRPSWAAAWRSGGGGAPSASRAATRQSRRAGIVTRPCC